MPGDTCDVAASLVVPTMTDQYGAAMVRTWPRYSNVVDRDRARRAGKRARTCEQDCVANREALLLRLRCCALATVPGGGRQVQAREWAPARTEPTKALVECGVALTADIMGLFAPSPWVLLPVGLAGIPARWRGAHGMVG